MLPATNGEFPILLTACKLERGEKGKGKLQIRCIDEWTEPYCRCGMAAHTHNHPFDSDQSCSNGATVVLPQPNQARPLVEGSIRATEMQILHANRCGISRPNKKQQLYSCSVV